jgi:hypothetical protein
MGLEACILCIAFLRYIVDTPLIINPFAGHGTALAVANYFGVPCMGIEILPKRCRRSMRRNLNDLIDSIPLDRLKLLGVRVAHDSDERHAVSLPQTISLEVSADDIIIEDDLNEDDWENESSTC